MATRDQIGNYECQSLAGALPSCFDMGMGDDLSHDAAHKLLAALNYDAANGDQDFPTAYIDACQWWFDNLSTSDRIVVTVARAAFHGDNKEAAMDIAAALPAAPKYPL